MSTFNIEKNRFMKKAYEKKSQREISTKRPHLMILNKDEEIDDLNSPTSPHLSIPIFNQTKFIFPNLVFQKTIK